VFVDESKVKTVPFGDFAEGTCLILALDGAVWVYTPAANSSSETWEIHRVDPILRMKLFDVEKQAQIVCDGHYGHWALNSIDKSNPRSERKLVFVANKFSHDGTRFVIMFGPIRLSSRTDLEAFGSTCRVKALLRPRSNQDFGIARHTSQPTS
jgi:hypothetical protein